jgi:Protein of unknown function (DUF998)
MRGEGDDLYREEESDGGDRLNTIAACITLSSIIYYVTAIILLHILRTDFDPRYRYLSEYVNGPYGALMTSTFFVLSLGSLALLFGLWRSVSSKIRFAPGMLLWLAWACAVFFAGVYPSDLQESPTTWNGHIHNRMGMIAFPSATLALPLLSLPLRWDKKWQSVWASAVLLSLPVIISFFVLDRLGEMQLGGLDQRIFLGVTLIWMWILGSKMLAIEKQRQR